MKTKKFDELFDEGKEDITPFLDISNAKRLNSSMPQRRINLDLPEWMIEELDNQARRIGITRQAIIKVWLANCLEMIESNKKSL
jgi:CopG antitoxin of type II toxin-antitoxin system